VLVVIISERAVAVSEVILRPFRARLLTINSEILGGLNSLSWKYTAKGCAHCVVYFTFISLSRVSSYINTGPTLNDAEGKVIWVR
jgi:hypothetical protein